MPYAASETPESEPAQPSTAEARASVGSGCFSRTWLFPGPWYKLVSGGALCVLPAQLHVPWSLGPLLKECFVEQLFIHGWLCPTKALQLK